MHWRRKIRERLIASAHPAGGWGYRSDCTPGAEPTSLACLAMSSVGLRPPELNGGLDWLARCQRKDGSVAVKDTMSAPGWTTAPAILAWRRAGDPVVNDHADNVHRAVRWLLSTRGLTFQRDPVTYGHDTTLAGWGWVRDTHSWVEPTSLAVLALRSVAMSDHPRVREAVNLILDRAIPGSGWNYGNRRIFHNHLRPFPAQTGMALTALAGEPTCDPVRSAIAYLETELEHIRAPMSLAWGLIGLNAWNKKPSWHDDALAECAARLDAKPPQPALDSLLLLASADRCPFTATAETARHG